MKPRQNDSSEMSPAPKTSAAPANPHGLSLHRDGANSNTVPAPPTNAISSAIKDRKNSMWGLPPVGLRIILEQRAARSLLIGSEQYQRRSMRLYCSMQALCEIAWKPLSSGNHTLWLADGADNPEPEIHSTLALLASKPLEQLPITPCSHSKAVGFR